MVGWLEQAFQTGTLNNIFQRKRLPEKWVCNLHGQEVHWYLILNQLSLKFIKYFWIPINKSLGVNLQYSSKPHPRNLIRSYFVININEAGPWTGSSLVFNLKPVFL